MGTVGASAERKVGRNEMLNISLGNKLPSPDVLSDQLLHADCCLQHPPLCTAVVACMTHRQLFCWSMSAEGKQLQSHRILASNGLNQTVISVEPVNSDMGINLGHAGIYYSPSPVGTSLI